MLSRFENLRRPLILVAIVSMVFSMFISIANTAALSRTDLGEYYDAEKYALAKVLLHAVMKCKRDVAVGNAGTAQQAIETGSFWDIWDIFNWAGVSVEGYWLEKQLPTNDNGYIRCVEDDGVSLPAAARTVWGVDMIDIVCDWRNHDNAGLFQAAGGSGSCQSATDVEFVSNDAAEQYLSALIKAKVMTEGSDGVAVTEFSAAEEYWLFKRTLELGKCSEYLDYSRSSEPSGFESSPVVWGFNNDGTYNIHYVISRSKDGKDLSQARTVSENHVWESQYGNRSGVTYDMTCGAMLDALAPESADTIAMQRLMQGRVVDDCVEQIEDGVDSKKGELTLVQQSLADEQAKDTPNQTNIDNFQRQITALEEYISTLESKLSKKANSGPEDTHAWSVNETSGDEDYGKIKCNFKEYEPPELDIPGDDPNVGGGVAECNIGVLGWIICPTAKGLGDLVDTLYVWIVENFIAVKASLFNTDNGTYTAWTIFRDFANVIFIILFLVVVFSQITGVGINNYGIKKILPKLIITAILINASYFVCQVTVDLSNILGSQVQGILASAAEQVLAGSGQPGGGAIMATIITFVLSAGAIAGVAFTVVFAFSAGSVWGLLGPLLLGILGCVVSVLFFFVILAARQVAIIMLVAVSPIAFACYILPNTEKIFKKWVDIMKSMLIVYPICGALVGAGQLASAIIMKADGTDAMFYIIAILMKIVPFIALPSLVKTSLAAVGNLGAKISGVGSRFGAWSKGKVGSATGLNDLTNDARRRQTQYRALKRSERLGSRLANNKSLSAGQRRRYAMYSGIAAGASAEDIKGYENMYSNMSVDGVTNDLSAALESNDINRQTAAIGHLSKIGQLDRIGEAVGSVKAGSMSLATAKNLQSVIMSDSKLKSEFAPLANYAKKLVESDGTEGKTMGQNFNDFLRSDSSTKGMLPAQYQSLDYNAAGYIQKQNGQFDAAGVASALSAGGVKDELLEKYMNAMNPNSDINKDSPEKAAQSEAFAKAVGSNISAGQFAGMNKNTVDFLNKQGILNGSAREQVYQALNDPRISNNISAENKAIMASALGDWSPSSGQQGASSGGNPSGSARPNESFGVRGNQGGGSSSSSPSIQISSGSQADIEQAKRDNPNHGSPR